MITPADSEVLRLAREWARLEALREKAFRDSLAPPDGMNRYLRAVADEREAMSALFGAIRAAYGKPATLDGSAEIADQERTT